MKMKQLIATGMITLLGVVGISTLVPASAYALDCKVTPNAPACQIIEGKNATGANKDTNCGDDGKQQCTLGDRVTLVVNVLLFIVGTISVIMIILGGIRYVLSSGDSSQITGAKNTILYSVIGLIVALLAYAIVNFVVGQFIK